MEQQLKKGGLTTDNCRPLYGMCAGGKDKMMRELMMEDKVRWNRSNQSIYSLIKKH
jgi:hypothetical protein